jgi:hypothetical protein
MQNEHHTRYIFEQLIECMKREKFIDSNTFERFIKKYKQLDIDKKGYEKDFQCNFLIARIALSPIKIGQYIEGGYDYGFDSFFNHYSVLEALTKSHNDKRTKEETQRILNLNLFKNEFSAKKIDKLINDIWSKYGFSNLRNHIAHGNITKLSKLLHANKHGDDKNGKFYCHYLKSAKKLRSFIMPIFKVLFDKGDLDHQDILYYIDKPNERYKLFNQEIKKQS